jgi:mono/diheme cytochrome c family protein
MKKMLKIIGIVLGSLVLVLLIAATYINFSEPPTYEVNASDLIVKSDSTSVAEGRRMAQMTCFQCHRNGDKLEGTLMEDEESPFGQVWASNITQHKENGIGKYTDGELEYMLRTGIKRNGTYAPPWMPKFPHLSDQDMNNIVAYLRSDMPEVQASDKVQPKSEYSFLTKVLLRVAFKPLPYDGTAVVAPPISDKVAYGKYLVTAKVDCYGCHSTDFKTQNSMEPEKTPGFFGGGNAFADENGNILHSANLTFDKETGIGNWSEEDFFKTLKSAQKPDGTFIRPPMTPFPLLRDEELSAIYAYLQSIPTIHNDVKKMNEDQIATDAD